MGIPKELWCDRSQLCRVGIPNDHNKYHTSNNDKVYRTGEKHPASGPLDNTRTHSCKPTWHKKNNILSERISEMQSK